MLRPSVRDRTVVGLQLFRQGSGLTPLRLVWPGRPRTGTGTDKHEHLRQSKAWQVTRDNTTSAVRLNGARGRHRGLWLSPT